MATATEKKSKRPIHIRLDDDLSRRLWHERAETGAYPSRTINEAVRLYFAERDRRADEDRQSA